MISAEDAGAPSSLGAVVGTAGGSRSRDLSRSMGREVLFLALLAALIVILANLWCALGARDELKSLLERGGLAAAAWNASPADVGRAPAPEAPGPRR